MDLTPQQRQEFSEDIRDLADKIERGEVSSAAVTFVDKTGEDVQFWIHAGQTATLIGAVEIMRSMIVNFEIDADFDDDTGFDEEEDS